METKFQIIGNENSIIYYNLNKQFSNIKKIIITKDILLNSFESPDIMNLFQRLKEINPKDYFNLITQCKTDKVFEIKLQNDLYSKIQDSLTKLSENMMDVKLKDFNFMNSISNSNLTVTLRTENFSISKYYIEKGGIINNIRHLIEEYLFNKINIYRLSRIDNFQIEIYESEEIHKKVILKKDNNILQLYSSFGFPYNIPIDYELGGEFYYSIGDDFNFYKNKQTHALIRDHTKIVEKEINSKDKILSNEELVTINNLTKNINDALIEIYLNSKGKVKILNVSLLDNELNTKSENGFIINKSSKNYNKITTINFRDNLDEDYPNPKYMIIQNSNEVKELLENLTILENIDGIIFTVNFYTQALDFLAVDLDIDIIYLNNEIGKSLECDFDRENVSIGSESNSSKELNPFNNIIASENKIEDAYLEKLKNIDLSTPPRNKENIGNEFNSNVSNLTESLLSSKDSTINNSNLNNSDLKSSSINDVSLYDSSGKKKNALTFLMEKTINKQNNKEKEIPNLNQIKNEIKEEKESINNLDNQINLDLGHSNNNNSNNNNSNNSISEDYNHFKNQNENNLDFTNSINGNNNYNNNQNNYNGDNENNLRNTLNNNFFDETIISNTNEKNKYEDILKVDIEPQKTNLISNNDQIKKYEKILATNILTVPNINSKKYFVDSNTLSMVTEGEIFYLTTNESELGNSNLKYIMPLELVKDGTKIDYYLINSANEFFLLNEEDFKNKKLFINLSKFESSIKENFLNFILKEVKSISLIILKEDLNLIKKNIHKIENLMIKDIISDEDYLEVEKKVLSFEKIYLMKED